MKHLRLSSILLVIILAINISSCCKDEINGTFLVSDTEKEFFPDTTIEYFNMVDNNGITDEFCIDKSIWYVDHHYLSRWSEPDKCGDGYVTDTYGVNYYSTLNNFYFMFVLRAGYQGTEMEIEWNQKFTIYYNFDTKKAVLRYPYISGLEENDTTTYYPQITFLDSLSVSDTVYHKIVCIDLLDIEDDVKIPKKIYLAKQLGLVKFELNNGAVYQRVE